MVFQIRGTSGSGKSYTVNKIMSKYSFKPITKNSEIMGYYCSELNLFIVGKYATACGGCDSIKTQDEICRRIKVAINKGWNVLFEGLICSHIALRYANIYKLCQKRKIGVKFCFLDTPLEVCRANINKRRLKAGKAPTTAKNTEKDYLTTHKSRENMAAMGVPLEDMPVLNAKQIYRLIIKSLKEEK